MRLLLVGMPASIHMARWAAGAVAAGLEVGLFPSDGAPANPAFANVTIFRPTPDGRYRPPAGVKVVPAPGMLRGVPTALGRAASLAAVIKAFRPDIVHAQEIQHGGHLAARAKGMLRNAPPLVLTIWGSDISLQSRIPAERARIMRTLRQVDVLTGDCERDLWQARRMGYTGETAMAMPVAGGFDLDRLAPLRVAGPVSARRTIVVKGYQHWAGRAQVAFRAIELCGSTLAGFHLAVHSVRPDEEVLAGHAAKAAGMELEVIGRLQRPVEHDDILRLHGRARISLGLSISDGISTGLLEAMVMGSFPIQSDTACASEWILPGESGLIVPPEDPGAVARALRAAATDDVLVDRAALINSETVRARLDAHVVQQRVFSLYERTVSGAIARG